MDYARLVAVLTRVVQQQQEQIEAQQAAIKALRARVEGMEKERDHRPQDHRTTGQRPALSRVEGTVKAGE